MTTNAENNPYPDVPPPARAGQCAYPWCDVRDNGPCGSHFGSAYTPATGRDEGVPLSIGVAISWYPDELPSHRTLVHLIDEIGDTDVDACLTLDEAIELRNLLDTAISHVAGFHTEVITK
jgi:hypothetical protein